MVYPSVELFTRLTARIVMSSSEPQDGPSPPEPPSTSPPLTWLVIPAVVVVALILIGYFAVIPVYKDTSRAQQKFREATKPIHVPYTPPPAPYSP
jgi:hypothetical protein